MLDPEQVTFLEGGCALIVGVVTADGRAVAARGWGLTVLDAASQEVRLLLERNDVVVDHLHPGSALAVTGTDVRTLRSLQLKGHVDHLEAATPADQDRANRFCDQFFTDIVETDLTPREIVERLRPGALVACLARLDELFDQTPGPGAGARLSDQR